MVAMAAALTGGCSTFDGHVRRLPTDRDVAMNADYRVVFRHRNREKGEPGRRLITCAEPSPDVARTVNEAMQFDISGSAAGAKVQPEVALALAASRAESLAQLGQRLATIQLLRDSTFKACEAFANGAIDASTYAMVVSRYDDVMVTLLLAEAAAGGFGAARPAAISGSSSTAPIGGALGQSIVRGAQGRVETAEAAIAAAKKDQAAAAALPAADTTRAEKIKLADEALVAGVAAQRTALDELQIAIRATTGAQAGGTVSAADGGVAKEAATQTAQILGAMQKRYLEDMNLDAIMVGCMSALSTEGSTKEDRNPRAPTTTTYPATGGKGAFASTAASGAVTIADQCRAVLANGSTLQDTMKAMQDIAVANAKRAAEEADKK
jgi:hypothetical protein